MSVVGRQRPSILGLMEIAAERPLYARKRSVGSVGFGSECFGTSKTPVLRKYRLICYPQCYPSNKGPHQ